MRGVEEIDFERESTPRNAEKVEIGSKKVQLVFARAHCETKKIKEKAEIGLVKIELGLEEIELVFARAARAQCETEKIEIGH